VTQPNGRNRRTSATLEEVAQLAGVSRATVSRVVNGSPRVSPDVRSDVQTAIDQLGYVPNRAARSLVTKRSDSIAVVITEPSARLFSDPFFPRLLRGISSELATRDRQLVLLMPESDKDEARTADFLTAGHVDGTVLVSLHAADPLPGRLSAAGIPTVMVGRPAKGVRASYVDVDNRQGAASAVGHLIESGRRLVATIAGPQDMAAGDDRLKGYRDALTEAGLTIDPTLEAIGDFTHAGGASAMARLLEARPDLNAVFAASDLMAVGALATLASAGRRVPADVAVVGYDDSPVATSTTPQLTSVRQPIESMGREVARLLLDGIETQDLVHRRVILTTELVRRASSAGRPAP
jgi:DNA-binding LacI/PurR family transcriptional regulator